VAGGTTVARIPEKEGTGDSGQWTGKTGKTGALRTGVGGSFF